jgi:hypothetical protein
MALSHLWLDLVQASLVFFFNHFFENELYNLEATYYIARKPLKHMEIVSLNCGFYYNK